jgi:hypothetical protein
MSRYIPRIENLRFHPSGRSNLLGFASSAWRKQMTHRFYNGREKHYMLVPCKTCGTRCFVPMSVFNSAPCDAKGQRILEVYCGPWGDSCKNPRIEGKRFP